MKAQQNKKAIHYEPSTGGIIGFYDFVQNKLPEPFVLVSYEVYRECLYLTENWFIIDSAPVYDPRPSKKHVRIGREWIDERFLYRNKFSLARTNLGEHYSPE